MRTLIAFLLISTSVCAAEPEIYYSHETQIGNVTYGYSSRGRYTRQQVGSVTVHQVYRNPTPAWRSTRVAPTKITYGTRPRSSSGPSR